MIDHSIFEFDKRIFDKLKEMIEEVMYKPTREKVCLFFKLIK